MTTLEPSNLALFWVGVIAVAILVYVILDGFDLEVTATGARLANGTFIPAELIVWAAGVKSPDILTKLDGLETNRASQLVVLPPLQTTRDPNIFAIGDCAAYPWAGQAGKTEPPRA
jgi:NADH dehydrogenase